MRDNLQYYKNSDSLTILLEKEDLRKLLNSARDNFFEFLYTNTEFFFYKKKTVKHFNLFCTKEYIKMSKQEAGEVYDKTGFQEVVSKIEDKLYYNLFTNYDIILNLDKNVLAKILLVDFKILLDISNMNLSEFKNPPGEHESK